MDFAFAAARPAAGRCCARVAHAAASGSRCSAGRRVPGSGKRGRFGLGPERRLSRRSDFERLLTQGKRRSMAGYTFFLARREEAPTPRLGILISRKHAAKATDRNGLKRCIREAFRLEQSRLGGLDMLIRPPYGARASAQMLERLRDLLGKVAA